jgi:DivIVA domain-containing protein
MDRLNVDRIRRVTFPVARRGYSKRAVDRFLDRLADWLEIGTGDPARADLMRREMARVGTRTAAILEEAEVAAQRLREEAERDAALIIRRAREEAAAIRADARTPPSRSVPAARGGSRAGSRKPPPVHT